MTAEDGDFQREAVPAGPLRRVVLGCSYDGTDFHGFARQPGQVTVAGSLLACLERIAGQPVPLTTAGRTDAGVHARTQVVHVDLPQAVVDRYAEPPEPGSVFGCELPGLARSLRNQLPPTIGVFRAAVAPPGFDARFGAIARRYGYDLVTSDRMGPGRRPTSWMVGKPLDLRSMRTASDPFVGEHDFAAFARRPKGSTGPITRRVIETRWTLLAEDHLRFEIEAGAFAHQMVRSIVGTLVAVGLGRLRTHDIVRFLGQGERLGLPTLAPPQGLTLLAVEYPPGLGGRWE